MDAWYMVRLFMSESQHQKAVIQWCASNGKAGLIFAIPNGTHIKSHQGRAKAKAEGLKKGVPDLFLPVANHDFHGLFIEMKKPKDDKSPAGKPTKEQLQWIEDLSNEGYMAVICVGVDAAIDTIKAYLK
jgi:hypothetical protein